MRIFKDGPRDLFLQSSPAAINVQTVGRDRAGPACGFPAIPQYVCPLPSSWLASWAFSELGTPKLPGLQFSSSNTPLCPPSAPGQLLSVQRSSSRASFPKASILESSSPGPDGILTLTWLLPIGCKTNSQKTYWQTRRLMDFKTIYHSLNPYCQPGTGLDTLLR